MYPICGALLGGAMGGPVGLVAGLKLGGLAAVGGGLAGNIFYVYIYSILIYKRSYIQLNY